MKHYSYEFQLDARVDIEAETEAEAQRIVDGILHGSTQCGVVVHEIAGDAESDALEGTCSPGGHAKLVAEDGSPIGYFEASDPFAELDAQMAAESEHDWPVTTANPDWTGADYQVQLPSGRWWPAENATDFDEAREQAKAAWSDLRRDARYGISIPAPVPARVAPLSWFKRNGDVQEGLNDRRYFRERAMTPFGAIFLMEKDGLFSIDGLFDLDGETFADAGSARAAAFIEFDSRMQAAVGVVANGQTADLAHA